MVQANPSSFPINEIFSSVQGEGANTGRPAVFVRMQYCPVGCAFCDTKHTWNRHPKDEIHFEQMLDKVQDAPTWANVSQGQLIEYLLNQPEHLIVLTGGEPCAYDLTDLTTALLELGKDVQIETSGTFEIKANLATWVTVSPKIDMPGGLRFKTSALYAASEIKMPIGKMADVEKLKKLLQPWAESKRQPLVWLQPLSQQEKATALCIEQARLNGWRLSAQLHKYLHVR